MRIFTDPLYEEFSLYTNPMLCSGDAGIMGDMGGMGGMGGTTVEDSPDVGGGTDAVEGIDTADAPDEGLTPEPEDGGELLADGDKEEVEQPEIEAGKPDKEVLPAALSKAIRELKAAHSDNPEIGKALKELNNAYYAHRAYKQIFASTDEARTSKAQLEAVGGAEGIAAMRGEISSLEQFDNMAARGDPRVIQGLADQFPDGFKRLVPAALDQLNRVDPAAFKETLRGPLLSVLEGDGLMDAVSQALEYMKAATTEPDAANIHYRSAQYKLNQIATWYQGLKQQETEYKGRYQDPRLKELESREQQLQTQQAEVIRTNVIRDLQGYLRNTMTPGINQVLQGKTLAQGGRVRFEQNVEQEIHRMLAANDHYKTSLKDLISNGKVEQAVNFAKPFIDNARRKAITSVYRDLYGNSPVGQPKLKTRVPTNGEPKVPISNKPALVMRQPAHDDIDWNKTTTLMFIQNQAVLNSGKSVTWGKATR